ncbi:MAG: DUF1697 domain-containing protein [Sciscionella sp.]
MPRYVALLRGINVGGNKRIAMAELRELLAGLGHTDVRTHLQSGNVVFGAAGTDSVELAGRIEEIIERRFGHSVRCLVRTRDELHAVIDGNPLGEHVDEGSKLIALFLSDAPDLSLLAEHDPTAFAPEDIRLGDRVIYQWCANGVLGSPNVGDFVRKHLRLEVTGRNWNTVTKLGTLLDAP